MSSRKGCDAIVAGTSLEKWLPRSSGGRVVPHDNFFHVTLYFNEGGHVSADIDKFSTESWGVHGTLYLYDEYGKKVGEETIDF